MRKINKKLSLMVAFVFLFSQCLSGIAFAGTHSTSTTGSITKAELASLLAKTFNLPSGTYQRFSDVSSKAWYKSVVGKATLAGIMSTTSKSFKPNSTMSRKTGAAIIYKAFRQTVPTISKPTGKLTRLEALKWIDKLTGTKISKSSSSRKTYGNVVIDKKNVVLKNATIKGNLIIAQGVGNGNVTLDNVKVEKTMIVMGGGENSIKMFNSAVKSVFVDKKDGRVRLLASGATHVGNVNMRSGGRLEEENMTAGSAGFTSMTVTGTNPNAPVILNADLTSVTVGAPNSFVEVLGNVTTFTAEAPCTVSGDGNISYADIEVSGVVLGNAPTNIRAREGIIVVVEGVVVDPTAVYGPVIPPLLQTVEQDTDEQYFTFNAGTKTITGYNTGGGSKVVIPSTIDGVAVTSIGVNAFRNKKLTKVTIGNNITSIGSGAFANNFLTSVIIPDSITYISWEAFAYNSLTGVTIPNSVTGIDSYAFYMNNPLASLTIGNRVTSIGDEAFEFAYGLTSITIPSSVINIGKYAFRCNYKLTKITIGPGVTLGDDLLDGTIYVHSNNFRDSYYPKKEAGTYTGTQSGAWIKITDQQYFNFNAATKTITGYNTAGGLDVLIPSEIGGVTVTSIGDNAFNGKSLTKVTIGSNVTRIGNGAFSDNSLTSIIIPDNVATIGNAAFKANVITSATIGNKVTSIGDSSFSGNHLSSITIGGNVTSIGANAFEYNSLTSLTIPNNVINIGEAAFSNNSLTSLIIGNKVTSIGKGAFTDNGLARITIGPGVNLGNYLLTTLNNNFRELYLASGAGKYVGTQTGAWIKPTDEQYFTFNAGTKAITGYNTAGGLNIIIPLTIGGVTVTCIGDNVFNNKGLISITLGSNINSIGDAAFSNNNLISIIIPDSVTRIGALVFENNSLASVTIPNNVTSIGEGAFRANSLTSVIMPDKIISIGDYAFTGNLIARVTIPNSVTSIGKGAFSNNSLTDVIVTDKVTSIGDYAFSRNALSSITIGSSVTSIGARAFSDNSLASVTIPDNVNTIGTRAFANNLLTSIIIGADMTIADNLLSWNNNFRDTYYPNKKAGDYTGTQEGAWTKLP